ncbi:uncharacterized protein N7483_010154 [Penicillium malachiteum]|uniref:uncharacterized protein n=1 Tax=Penicillium malachiteum TaxID=1324776 RepID=UPI00254785DF|nr:uncharacterized protein N7483_010154 [Penicillium malachiteum]KAJ5712973.1 hypothetical protein N7483_010154 [Penicillium malachiteum]
MATSTAVLSIHLTGLCLGIKCAYLHDQALPSTQQQSFGVPGAKVSEKPFAAFHFNITYPAVSPWSRFFCPFRTLSIAFKYCYLSSSPFFIHFPSNHYLAALMMLDCSQPVEYNNERSLDDNSSSDMSEVFSDIKSDSDSNTDLELDSENSDSDDDKLDGSVFSDEGQLSPEYYLAQAESLDVSQLRQKRYADSTQGYLDNTRIYWDRYYRHIGVDLVLHWKSISDFNETVQFLYGFFGWRCDICRGKDGRHCPGFQVKSSLQTFWKWWHLVLKQETESELNKETIRKVEDIITLMAEEKKLKLTQRPKKNIYIKDVAEFAYILLKTTEMTYRCG